MDTRFGILIFPQAEELDFVGPWEMLTMWSKYASGPEHCLIVAQSAAPVQCAKGMLVVQERFVRDGNVWSSAGVSAGIDLMLAFIASVASEETAGKVQFHSEYYPSQTRYGGFEKRADAPAYLSAKNP